MVTNVGMEPCLISELFLSVDARGDSTPTSAPALLGELASPSLSLRLTPGGLSDGLGEVDSLLPSLFLFAAPPSEAGVYMVILLERLSAPLLPVLSLPEFPEPVGCSLKQHIPCLMLWQYAPFMRWVRLGISTRARSFSLVGELSVAGRGRGGSVAKLMMVPTDCGSV